MGSSATADVAPAAALSVHLEIAHQAREPRAVPGMLHTPHGSVETPFFCVVGTAATVGRNAG
jgi:hypothetical protein